MNDSMDDYHSTRVIDKEVFQSKGTYKEIEGNLIKLAQEGSFDVIAHGCNTQCTMGAGIAPQIARAFEANNFKMEAEQYRGDYNKLGTIDYEWVSWDGKRNMEGLDDSEFYNLAVVNCYTQDLFGRNHSDGVAIPLDYEALTLCMRKINHEFEGKSIGLPLIGCSLGGGSWERVKQIIKQELCDCHVTIVNYKK